MSNTLRKTGRPMAEYRTADGDKIKGLSKLGDGRWRVSVIPGERHTFTAADEPAALAKFGEIVAKHGDKKIDMPVKLDISWHNGILFHSASLSEADYVARVRQDIMKRAEWLAQATGIEWLAWHDHQRPADSPKLSEVVEHYATKPGLSHDETVRARKQWAEFCKAAGVETLHDITHDAVAKYEKKLAGETLSPKSIKHRYTKIKTIVAHAMKRGVDSKECRAALDVLKMLEVPDATPLAPHPIDTDDFWKVHAKAEKAGDKSFAAMMLTAANCCMYSGEVAALKWEELNLKTGEVVTRRPKTGVARVAILWPETLEAIKALPRERDYVFFSQRRSYTTNLVSRHWADYRDAANLPESIKFGDIRDAAYTTACQNVSLDKAKVLAGHRLSGATDHYVQRNPGFVGDACEAIHRSFYPAKPAK